MKNKKSTLTINMIIVMAISLTFLFLIGYLIAKNTNLFTKGVSDCESRGGSCVKENECEYEKSYLGCENKEKEERFVCCINPLE